MSDYAITLSLILSPVLVGFFLKHLFERQRETLDQIHILVNARLTEALDSITELKQELAEERLKSGS